MSPSSTSGGPPDPELATSLHVRRAVGGDTDSVAWLVERLNPLLLAQASWRMGTQLRHVCDPVDLVQEAWLILLPRLPELRAQQNRLTPVLLSFLSTTILRRLQNLLRREARRRVRSADREEDDTRILDQESPHSGVVSSIVRSELRCRVREALDGLPDQDREIILLRGIEQRSLDDLAARTGATRKALSKRYSRALQKLRESLPDSVFCELQDE